MELLNAKKSLKAAAAEAGGSHGLFVGYSAGKKADNGKGVSGPEGTMTAVAVAVASASAAAAAAVEAAKHAAVASASAKHAALAAVVAKLAEHAAAAAKLAEEAAMAAKLAEKEAAAAVEAGAEQAEQEASAADDDDEEEEEDATDSDAEYDSRMSGLEYILTYKALPQYEIDIHLENPVKRVPFTATELFKTLSADPTVTQDDIDAAAAEHEDRLDKRERFKEFVRREYEAKGYVAVGEEYIARRIEAEAFTKKRWAELFAESDDDDSDEEEEQEAGEEIAQ